MTKSSSWWIITKYGHFVSNIIFKISTTFHQTILMSPWQNSKARVQLILHLILIRCSGDWLLLIVTCQSWLSSLVVHMKYVILKIVHHVRVQQCVNNLMMTLMCPGFNQRSIWIIRFVGNPTTTTVLYLHHLLGIPLYFVFLACVFKICKMFWFMCCQIIVSDWYNSTSCLIITKDSLPTHSER